MSTALSRPRYLDLDSFARACGLHPDMVARLVALGLLEVERDARGRQVFDPGQIASAARLQRLRRGLALNYAALGVVVDLLDRIAELETAVRLRPLSTGANRWTRTV